MSYFVLTSRLSVCVSRALARLCSTSKSLSLQTSRLDGKCQNTLTFVFLSQLSPFLPKTPSDFPFNTCFLANIRCRVTGACSSNLSVACLLFVLHLNIYTVASLRGTPSFLTAKRCLHRLPSRKQKPAKLKAILNVTARF